MYTTLRMYQGASQGANLNILSHAQAMKAIDKEKFEMSMADELEKMFKNDIYEIIKKTDVR